MQNAMSLLYKKNACLLSSSMSSSGIMSSLGLQRTCYIGIPSNVSSEGTNQMDRISDAPTQLLYEATPGKQTFPGSRRTFWIVLWVIGAIILGVAAFLVHDLYSYHSFPSGHVTHDVVCYGFLLFLTFTKPAREWRYRWVLIPFQIFFIFDLLFIGFSRVLEGDHWLFDVLGGYLTGALWLILFIFLYRWATDRWMQYRHKKIAENRL